MIYVKLSDIFKNAETRPAGYVDYVLSQAIEHNDIIAIFTVEAYDNLCMQYRENYEPLVRTARPVEYSDDITVTQPAGPGTFLVRILAWYGHTASPTCPCMRNAKLMNANGPDWCQSKQAVILSWVADEAAKRNLSYDPEGVKVLVQKAIDLSRKALGHG
jgi:hypothetical protein